MSAPDADPPLPPSAPSNGIIEKNEPSNSTNEAAPASGIPAPTGDVKMEEAKTVEDGFEDIPGSIISASFRSRAACLTYAERDSSPIRKR